MTENPRIIIDDFLSNPIKYRQHALAQRFYNVRGPDGEYYKRICVQPSDEFEPDIRAAIDCPVRIGYSLLRLNYDGENPNNAIHSDNSYDEYAGILYLNTPEQCQGGTAFWRHKWSGFAAFPTEEEIADAGLDREKVYENLGLSWNDPDAWEQIEMVPMRFNRLLVYSTRRFHSRWPFNAFGTKPEDGRLIQVFFFSPA